MQIIICCLKTGMVAVRANVLQHADLKLALKLRHTYHLLVLLYLATNPYFTVFFRTFREIIPLDKWELLPEQIEYGEELGRGAFGVVYKATLKRRVGIEVFDTNKRLKPKDESKVVAVKVLQGILPSFARQNTKANTVNEILCRPFINYISLNFNN